jgi:hypothetical protein
LEALHADYETKCFDTKMTFRAARKSFSNAKYEEVAAFFRMKINKEDPFEQWEELDVPEMLLPASVLDEICVSSLKSHTVSPGSAAILSGVSVWSLHVNLPLTNRISVVSRGGLSLRRHSMP